MIFNYKTKLIWFNQRILIPFYKYNNNIGFIPADINFIYKNKVYSTINVMNFLIILYNNKKLKKTQFTNSYWYNKDGKFNKRLFIKFSDELIKTINQ